VSVNSSVEATGAASSGEPKKKKKKKKRRRSEEEGEEAEARARKERESFFIVYVSHVSKAEIVRKKQKRNCTTTHS
jgi:hypothetical protein